MVLFLQDNESLWTVLHKDLNLYDEDLFPVMSQENPICLIINEAR